MAQLVERHPVDQKVAGLIPSQGTYLGYGFGSRSGHVQETTNRCFSRQCVCVSLSLSLPLPKHVLG